ncbi:unnamed protein product [Somion occarium]|uniref:Mitochondrial import inner membrane translocase subunit TIM54 n=1 Tax=Somion occarium TaxID=3059160 RepID=A0ABP1DCS7_9APHY
MSTSSHGGDSKFPVPEQRQHSGVKAALRYTGIPPSWLDKRPSLPSRNWLIFLGVTSSVTAWYIYDRRQCKKIRQEYVERVKYLSEVPLHSLDYPRKVTVYGSKWPGDEDSDRSMKYFRKYVKPVFVAAAIDYEMINGRRHGELANRIAETIKARRRLDLGIDQLPQAVMVLPGTSPEEKRKRELEGGLVIIGRPTFKEFMAGLKRGWTESLEKVDREEQLSKHLELDGRFDEPPELETTADVGDIDGEPIPTPSKLPPSNAYSVFTAPRLRQQESAPRLSSDSSIPSHLNIPPEKIPPVPPILLVDFVNYIGLTQIPHMIWEFFNERYKVRAGAEAAYKLTMGETRPFVGPSESSFDSLLEDPTISPAQPYPSEILPQPTDLRFGKETESWYKSSTVKAFTSDIQKAREEYYKELPKKLETARALARGTREPTKDEKSYPPPTEVELRAERMKKELRWTSDEAGWEIIKPEKEAEWDRRFKDALRVFTEPSRQKDETARGQEDSMAS